MPIYNAQQSIAQSIGSIIAQSFQEWELLLVDDGSTDDTVNIIQLFLADKRIKLSLLKKNVGVAAARNIGLAASKGYYICFLDADDTWEPSKLSAQVEFMEKSGVSISYCKYRRVNVDDKVLAFPKFKKHITLRDMYYRNHIPLLTGMYKKELNPSQLFRNIKHEDYLFWIELLKFTDAFLVPSTEVLASYRVYQGSVSGNKLKAAGWYWSILRNELHFGILTVFERFRPITEN